MNLVHIMQLPEDSLKGNIVVTLYGREKLRIENFRGISTYTSEKITIITRSDIFSVSGKELEIQYLDKEEIEITGFFIKMEYDQV